MRASNAICSMLQAAVLALVALCSSSANAQAPGRHDVYLALDSPLSIVDLELGDEESELHPVVTSLSFTTDSAFCNDPGCVFTLNHLTVQFQDFTTDVTLDGEPAHFSVGSPTVLIEGPLTLVRQNGELVIPQGTPALASAFVSGGSSDESITPGTRRSNTQTLSDTVIRLNSIVQVATVDGLFDFTIPVMGVTVSGNADVMASNAGPFLNLPPVADAGPDLSVTCPSVLTLDGSGSTDPQNNQREYIWRSGFRAIASRVPVTQAFFGAGQHQVNLTVFDLFNSSHTDTTLITVEDPPPEFTSFPADLVVEQCGALNIGAAQAASPCESVTVTNDAPAFFYAGVTLVTWTGTTPSGKSITETQRVVVIPNDNAACCPPGSNVIVGTSNNDTLTGTPGRDCILGRNAQDVIDGGGGDDIISGGEGDDRISGGAGGDVISAGSGQDQVYGNDGNDSMFGRDGDDRLEGGPGDDLLAGGQGQDELRCGPGNDEAAGNDGDDRLFGDEGDDVLDGGEHNDQCTGGSGIDQFLSCTVQDQVDTPPPPPPGGGSDDFNVCLCRPEKCNDCVAGVQACSATQGCPSIIQCLSITAGCNLPHECSATCEANQTTAAINAARNLASCFGGC